MDLNTPEELAWLNEFHPPEEIAQRLSVATAFVRLTLELGCEVLDGRTSAAAVVFFLNENIDRVRAACGLPPLPQIGDDVPHQERLSQEVLNGYSTMAEYSISRATQPEAKEVWEARIEDAEETVRDLLDGADR